MMDKKTRVLLTEILDFIGTEGIVNYVFSRKNEQMCSRIRLVLKNKKQRARACTSLEVTTQNV